ncbi:type II secretion system F family protein [Methanobrevibacter sp.]|uniref:type II secretion system F family protein n=1 Tax=Methanobrevibacter sp. TaxID=66852 RepID=UPI00388F22FB
MLNNMFIFIGGIVLSFINFFKNLSFKNFEFKRERKTKEINAEIFSRLKFEEVKIQKKEKTPMDNLREVLLKYLANKQAILIILIISTLLMLFASLEVVGMFLTIIVMIYIFIFAYPQIKQERSYSDINQELPYALRHMGIELKSGKGLHDAFITIKNADYGSLSWEFSRVLEEIKYGKSTEESLLDMSDRIKSEGLTRSIQQIVGTLRVGGNLAGNLEIIAKDISFDMQIKLKEYSQRLNSFILIYTFIAILAPVIGLIMLMASSTVMGDVISADMLLIIYALFFPMVVLFMGVFIKKLEPKI